MPLQSTGRVGKSTTIELVLSWLLASQNKSNGLTPSALDADGEHQTLSRRFPWATLYRKAASERDAFREMIANIGDHDSTVIDFPAQATEFLLSSFAEFGVVELFKEKGLRLTILLFPADDPTALSSLGTVVKALKTDVDYIIVKNPARYKTDQWDDLPLRDVLTAKGACEITLPALTAPTIDEVKRVSQESASHLTYVDAIAKVDGASAHELLHFKSSVFSQLDKAAHLLVPSPDAITLTDAPASTVLPEVDQFDPLGGIDLD